MAAFLLFLSVSSAKFLLVPLLRWVLIYSFKALAGEEGVLRTIRQILSYPVRALIGRQRKARHGDADSQVDLFFVDVGFGMLISTFVQGLGVTVLTAFCIVVLTIIGVVVADR